jgi:hypothetical protein
MQSTPTTISLSSVNITLDCAATRPMPTHSARPLVDIDTGSGAVGDSA